MTPTEKDRFFTYAHALPQNESWSKTKAQELTDILRNKIIMEAMGRAIQEGEGQEKSWRSLNLGTEEGRVRAVQMQGMAMGMSRFVDILLELTEEQG